MTDDATPAPEYRPGQPVWVRYPAADQDERGDWPWMAGEIETVIPPDPPYDKQKPANEWEVAVIDKRADLADPNTRDDDYAPLCYRSADELRPRKPGEAAPIRVSPPPQTEPPFDET